MGEENQRSETWAITQGGVKRLRRSAQATEDLEKAFDYYFDVVNLEVAERFSDEVDRAMSHISQNPGTGSLRYSTPKTGESFDVRFWTLHRFPYAIFYVESKEYVHIVRVLHQSSNIPIHLES